MSTTAKSDLSMAIIAALNSDIYDVQLGFPRQLSNTRILLDVEAYLKKAEFTGANGGKYVIQILDALAFLLISKPTTEVIALSMRIVPKHQLYISSNGSNLNAASKHLGQIFSSITSIRMMRPEIRRGSTTPPVGEVDPNHALGTAIDSLFKIAYKYALLKLLNRFKKNVAILIKEFVSKVADRLSNYGPAEETTEQGSQLKRIVETDMRYIVQMDMIIRAADRCDKNPRDLDQSRDLLRQLISRAINEIKNNASVEGAHATSLYSRCSTILQEDYGVTKKDAFRRFWDKVFKLDLCVRQILCLTASPAMYRLPLPEIIVVPNLEKITLQYDFQDPEFRALFNANPGIVSDAGASTGEERILDYEGFLNMFKGKKLGTKIKAECHPHCEVNLLAYLLKNSIRACPYIAVSKLACVGCWMYFSAYNDIC